MREPGSELVPARKVAVALRYDAEQESAPRVVAKGRGLAAERLLDTATGAGVPVLTDAPLARTLAALDLDAVVPPELFEALAAVISWAYEQETLPR
jgi:flagellar biosynthesis protein